MSDVSELKTRLENAFTSAMDKAKQQQQQVLQEHLQRHQRLKEYEKALGKVLAIAKPRLEVLANRAGERVKVSPVVTETRRAVTFEFRSPKAYVTLNFSLVPDHDVNNFVLAYDLRIIPMLWNYNAHAEFSTPIAGPDEAGIARWLDDRIVEFAELFIKIHGEEIYDKAEYVEDPVAKVKFPKFAAGATLEKNGQTYYFIDESTKREFAK
jgi:YHS domain-containing protein